MGNTLSEVFAPSSPNSLQILASGFWRENIEDSACAFNKLKNKLPDYLSLSLISQEEEGIKSAQCAHRYMMIQGYIETLIASSESVFDEPLFLYIGAGRGSTQIVLLKADGSPHVIFNGPGYPRTGVSPIKSLSLICEDIKRVHDGTILAIFGYDSIFHILKTECPVVKDKQLLPETITTTGKDFRKLGYLATHFEDVPMLVFRNFKTKDNIMRKVSFLLEDSGDWKIDLGSGEAKLIDSSDGRQIKVVELPKDWRTKEESLDEIVDILEDMAHYSEHEESESEEKEADSIWKFSRYLYV